MRALNGPLLVLTLVMLGRGWYLNVSHLGWRSPWAKRSSLVLVASTVMAASLWGVRFAGLLGTRPF